MKDKWLRKPPKIFKKEVKTLILKNKSYKLKLEHLFYMFVNIKWGRVYRKMVNFLFTDIGSLKA